jgi:hypothetical protein
MSRRCRRRRRGVGTMLAARALLLVAAGAFPLRAASGEPDGLEVSLRPPSEAFSQRGPVDVLLGIQNHSQGPVKLDLGLDHKAALLMSFRLPDGTRVKRQYPLDNEAFGASGRLTLAPGQSYDETVVLNDWQGFEQLGSYEVEVELPPVQEPVSLRSQRLAAAAHFRVVPRDPAMLEAACKRLQAATLGREPHAVMDAAHALSFATDESCLPSLVAVLRTSYHGRHGAVIGLARLGSPGAIQAIVSAWDEVAILGGLRGGASTYSQGALEAALRLDAETFSLREPIIAVLQIRNRSQSSVTFDLGLNFKGNLSLTVSQPDGRRTVRRLPEAFDSFGAIGRVTLAPGQTYQGRMVLNDWQTFDQVGDYEVEVELPPVQEPLGLHGEKLTVSCHFRVTQRDPVLLLAACKRLEGAALGNEPNAIRDAAYALSFVTDEICLPSLKRVLKAAYLGRDDVIRALAKIGTATAIAVVVDAWDVLDKHSQKSALREFNYVDAAAALREALKRAGKQVTE